MIDDDYLELLQALMQPDASLERAYGELQRRHVDGRAAAAAVEALMFSLRERGTAALKEASTLRRLSSLSEQQLHEVSARLQRLKPEIARAWSDAEVERLVEQWVTSHGE
jgi:hypothetical protein